jgi:hypothetical protein
VSRRQWRCKMAGDAVCLLSRRAWLGAPAAAMADAYRRQSRRKEERGGESRGRQWYSVTHTWRKGGVARAPEGTDVGAGAATHGQHGCAPRAPSPVFISVYNFCKG